MQECSRDVCRDKEWSGGERGPCAGPPYLFASPARTSTRPPPFLHAAPCPYNPYEDKHKAPSLSPRRSLSLQSLRITFLYIRLRWCRPGGLPDRLDLVRYPQVHRHRKHRLNDRWTR